MRRPPMATKVDQEAYKLVNVLYKATEGRPLRWRTVIGLAEKQGAVDYAVKRGWIVFDGKQSVCLTVKGARIVRDAQS